MEVCSQSDLAQESGILCKSSKYQFMNQLVRRDHRVGELLGRISGA